MASPVDSDQSSPSRGYGAGASKAKEKRQWKIFGKIKSVWKGLGIDRPTFLLMMKGALAPTICIAMYEADAVSSQFSTVGYLVSVISVLGFSIMPRAKFIQMMVLDVLAVCVATAVALLMMYSCIKARQHTESAADAASGSASSAPYNASATAVSGVWLFFQIYVVHTFRAKFQQFQFPVIIYSIIANVIFTYASRLANMTAGIALAVRLLEASLTGLGVATGVSLFILPMSTRGIVLNQMANYIGSLRGALNAHTAYFETLEHGDMFGRAETYDSTVEKITDKGKVYSPEAQAIRTACQKVTELHAKIHGDLTFAKREFAIGKLGPDDIQGIFRYLRQIMIPVVGLSFVVDIFQRLSDYNKWNQPIEANGAAIPDAVRERVKEEWNEIMSAVHDPFSSMIRTIDEGLRHASLALELTRPAKKPATGKDTEDVEATANPQPGEKGFSAYYERKIRDFKYAKRIALRSWSEEKGIVLPPDFFEHPSSVHLDVDDIPADSFGVGRDRSRRQLYLILYVEQLLESTGHVVHEFIQFTDEKIASGKLSRNRLIIPGSKRLWKWITRVFKAEDSHEEDNLGGDINAQSNILQLGEAYKHRKDPEHLPPENTIQKIGDKIRLIPSGLRSPESAYGFRVACATMTVAVICLLHDTQNFFVKQRFVWAMIMVNMSMSPTSGQSIFGFVLRILGTVISLVLSMLAWYIPGQKTPGIIVFLFIFLTCVFYVPIKLFRFRIVGIITIISTSMIVGYELEVRKIGQDVATSNGQQYYPIYLLGPYRLATVAGGIAVAFIWTFFPYPISEHSVLRQSLGASLYLLANYYSIIHETVSARMRGDEGDLALKTSSGRRLMKARNKVFSKQMLMLNNLRTYAGFLNWEVAIGGRFPKKRYNSIITCIENIVSYLSLLGYASDTLLQLGNDEESDSAWLQDFRRLVASARVTTHEITTVLCLLSASITNQQPLPPYLKTPRPYSFSKRLEALDKDILSLRHIAEPGFATFSVLQISTRCIVGDVKRLMKDVKALVGELDFSFHAISTAHSVKSSAEVSRFSRPSSRDKAD
ncbi:MFS transporter [Aspergillus ellipticus CBS 707.79]|uniref:MFS transporter n=1 Tax=Aspergillus ellipticus CBS 707.79 TaxID=1448320 RepID=A0A319DKG7_9EURO|nr:MFS transporter [Aspergillus ellipticus CBS 707.79]